MSKIKGCCAFVRGLDASVHLIQAAQRSYGLSNNMIWTVQDCRYLEASPALEMEKYSKVFSNAALYWILRERITRSSVLKAVYKALRPSGTFVSEMGGAGQVAEVHTALLSAIVHQGMNIQQARNASSWYFPSGK